MEAQATKTDEAARKRAAVELIATEEAALRRTARRYSLDGGDAEDAYQRALEIVLTKAPTTDPRELIRWTQTVTKHEALALRQSRERLLGRRPAPGEDDYDPIAQLRAPGEGPEEQVERREMIARSREALRTLKPAERRALGLLAEGYSYAEISEQTGFSRTKVNRVLAEGRDRLRSVIAGSEDGTRCRQLRPLLSVFCDGEASPRDAAAVREHLRACARCRATMRAYRATPRIAVLAPVLPSHSLLERARDLLADWASRLPGAGGGGAAGQVTAAGPGGAGIAATAKALAVCAGVTGGAAACMATGVLPGPREIAPDRERQGVIVRTVDRPAGKTGGGAAHDQPAAPALRHQSSRDSGAGPDTEATAGPIEYEATAPSPAPSPPAPVPAAPPPAPASAAPEPAPAPTPDSAAGEFGP